MTKELMSKAATALASARLLLEAKDSDGAAYYGMFDVATAALQWVGSRPVQILRKPTAGSSEASG